MLGLIGPLLLRFGAPGSPASQPAAHERRSGAAAAWLPTGGRA